LKRFHYGPKVVLGEVGPAGVVDIRIDSPLLCICAGVDRRDSAVSFFERSGSRIVSPGVCRFLGVPEEFPELSHCGGQEVSQIPSAVEFVYYSRLEKIAGHSEELFGSSAQSTGRGWDVISLKILLYPFPHIYCAVHLWTGLNVPVVELNGLA
jgi:hypothetical protein